MLCILAQDCSFVHLSVTFRYYVQMAKHIISIHSLPGCPIILVFAELKTCSVTQMRHRNLAIYCLLLLLSFLLSWIRKLHLFLKFPVKYNRFNWYKLQQAVSKGNESDSDVDKKCKQGRLTDPEHRQHIHRCLETRPTVLWSPSYTHQTPCGHNEDESTNFSVHELTTPVLLQTITTGLTTSSYSQQRGTTEADVLLWSYLK